MNLFEHVADFRVVWAGEHRPSRVASGDGQRHLAGVVVASFHQTLGSKRAQKVELEFPICIQIVSAKVSLILLK